MTRPASSPPLLAFLLAACVPQTVPPASVPHPPSANPALTRLLSSPARARDIACDLSDRVGPRLAGSSGDPRAVEWALAKMEELGLSDVHSEPVTVPHWERGAGAAQLTAPAIQPLFVAALGGSVATPPEGIEAEVLEVGSLEALAALPADSARGKIVFFNKPMLRSRNGFEGYGKAVDVRRSGAAEAAKRGAVASVIRSIGTSTARFPHTGGMRYDEGGPRIPAAALAIPDAELIDRLLKAGQTVRMRLFLDPKTEPDATSANVVGEVRGREKPDEVILLGAHLDAWDLGRGAIDDGAGVGLVLDMAGALLANPPRRTIRVVLFANEENGLRGAAEYARAHAAELPRHHAAMEMDSGAGRAFALEWSAGPSASATFEAMSGPLSALGVEKPTLAADAGGADTIPVHAAGVPTLELRQDGSRYFDLHHTADDTCDKIEPEEIAQVRDAGLIAVWTLDQAPALLERAPARNEGKR